MNLDKCTGRVFSLLLILVFNFSAVLAGSERSPLDVIRSGTEKVLAIVRSCTPEHPFRISEHRDELEEIVSEYMDFDEMAVRVLGRHWKVQSPKNKEEFKRLFKELLFQSYVDKFDNYVCGREKVLYIGQVIRGRYALVKTKVIGYKDTDVVVEYRLKRKPDGWKVYDVVVEGISLVQNYRSQFNSILCRESFDSLLDRLREKIQAQRNARKSRETPVWETESVKNEVLTK